MLIKPLKIGKLPIKYEDKLYTTRTFIFKRTRFKFFLNCPKCDFYSPNNQRCSKYTVLNWNNWSTKTLYSLCTKFEYYKLFKIT